MVAILLFSAEFGWQGGDTQVAFTDRIQTSRYIVEYNKILYQEMAWTEAASSLMESREVWSSNQRLLHPLLTSTLVLTCASSYISAVS